MSIDGRLFPVAADADVNRKLGGFENDVQSNGNGTARLVKTRVPWKLDGIALEVNDDRADQSFLQDVANAKDYRVITITFASGHTFQGRGTISGELQRSSQNATSPITLMGPGELTPQ